MIGPAENSAAAGGTLAALAHASETGAALVIGQLGQSLDGRIATPSGHSHYINGPETITLLHGLRAGVDAVVIGAGTAIADNPRLTVRHGGYRGTPARVLIDRNRRAGNALAMFADDGARRIVFGAGLTDDPPGLEVIAAFGDGPLDPHAILAALAERGLRRVLIEGGAVTVSAFLSAGALHRLVIMIGPMLIGSGPVGLSLPAIDRLDQALRPAIAWTVMPGGDLIADCDLGKG